MKSDARAGGQAQLRGDQPGFERVASRLIDLIHGLSQQTEVEFRALAQDRFGIGTGDLRILFALQRVGACRPTELFQNLLITSGAVSKQVARLCDRDLVERCADPAHKGAVLLRLTQAGREIAMGAAELMVRQSRVVRALKLQPGDEVDVAMELLERLMAAVEGR